MQRELIDAKISQFREERGLHDEKESVVFERFVNNAILSGHNGGSVEDELLDAVSVGGSNDMGLDGICIKLNGLLVKSIEEAKDIAEDPQIQDVEVEYIFIQSKQSRSFKQDEFGNFITGVSDFLSEKHYQPKNDEIKYWMDIKDYLDSDEVILKMRENPIARLYYVAMGTWKNDGHIIGLSNSLKDGLKKGYDEIFVNYIDMDRLKAMIDDNENKFETVIDVIESFKLPPVEEVNNSYIILSTASELMKLLVTEEGLLRKGLFNDNVRDYQGETTVNQDIRNTVESEPKSFVLKNNGVTIICNESNLKGRKLAVRNPQIVNGCQTCSTLFHAYKSNRNLNDIFVVCKIISTDSSDIANNVIRGTNRQNIVYDEIFECTREFHKQLEEFFRVLSENRADKIYYERRAKQYNGDEKIKPCQRISFSILIRSFVSIFLNEPHNGHRHEHTLLQMYRGKIFIDEQSMKPYYVASLIYAKTDRFLRESAEYEDVKTYRAHLQMIIRIMMGEGKGCDINNKKSIEKYCDTLLDKIDSQDEFNRYAKGTIDFFRKSKDLWLKGKGDNYQYGIKDSPEFTKTLLDGLAAHPSLTNDYRGKVIKVRNDKNNLAYGFVSNSRGSFFFHSKENPELDFSNLQGKDVLFEIDKDRKKKTDKAIHVRVLE